jgi:protein-S-isoprenylcysteine O-methyltransferase Ste14
LARRGVAAVALLAALVGIGFAAAQGDVGAWIISSVMVVFLLGLIILRLLGWIILGARGLIIRVRHHPAE